MRLFAAIGIPPHQGNLLRALEGGIPGAHWVEPDSYHITLRFIGEASRVQADEIDAELTALAAPEFTLALSGLGQFKTGDRPRLLWAGVEPNAGLAHLARKIDRAVVAAGLVPEERNFLPHVTLARLKNTAMPSVMEFLTECALFRAPPFVVDHFTLFESRRGNLDPVYVPIADYPLRALANED